MSTEDYKRGVEDALKLMAAHNVQNGYIQPTLEHIRTTLLTKKVTKWVNTYTQIPTAAYKQEIEVSTTVTQRPCPILLTQILGVNTSGPSQSKSTYPSNKETK